MKKAKPPVKRPAQAKAPAPKKVDFTRIAAAAGDKKIVLHIGCGAANPAKLHKTFQGPEWHELRLDIDANVKPDIIADMTDMAAVPDGSVDAVWSSHNIEHLYPHQVPGAFAEIFRVLKPSGFFLVTLPDIQSVASYVANGNLEDPIYDSPAGPICPIDILYGYRAAMARGNLFMAHKNGFTAQTLAHRLRDAGFCNIRVQRQYLDLWAVAHRYPVGHPQRVEKIMIEQNDKSANLKAPPPPPLNRTPHPGALGPGRLTDELDIPPKRYQSPGLKQA